ncbi:DUF6491 family protein [Maricaulaceae bacterium EIL42A08]|nr:DUF6491 family protein [Maricaulaceae bacterium EIL42A08]
MTRLNAALLGLTLAAFGTSGIQAQDAAVDGTSEPVQEPPRCVRLVNINGYSVIDNQHMVLNGGASRHYLVTLRRSCTGLRFGAQVGTTFRSNARVCQPVVEDVITSDGWRCPIDTVEEVESLEAAEALIESRAEAEAHAQGSR